VCAFGRQHQNGFRSSAEKAAEVNIRSAVLAGGSAGLAAGLMFATLHALIIVPIWTRMTGGLMFGAIAGAAAGWAYAELQRNVAEPGVRSGAIFGLLLWCSIAPVTLTNIALRSSGFASEHRNITDTIAVILAVAGGAALGWLRTRRLRTIIACAVAALVLTMAMGGPVPAGRNVRTAGIFLAMLVASVMGGAMVGVLLRTRARGEP
jgi:hypothetical protein